MVLADLGYRRVLLFERWLDEPITPVTPRAPVTFSKLEPAQIDEYLRFHDATSRPRLEERFARGDECFVARHDGRIVCASWATRKEFLMSSMHYRYAVGPSEAYLYDSFADPAFRGRAIAPALGVHVLERFRCAGVTRATLAVHPENVANRRARAKNAFRLCERIDCLQLGNRVWHWHREKRERGERRSRAGVPHRNR
jgi:ribosomal protein S18 acetylase RimI-like enzyme